VRKIQLCALVRKMQFCIVKKGTTRKTGTQKVTFLAS